MREAIEQGKSTALYYAGSTEQNGPHMAIGKHNFIARYVAGAIAIKFEAAYLRSLKFDRVTPIDGGRYLIAENYQGPRGDYPRFVAGEE